MEYGEWKLSFGDYELQRHLDEDDLEILKEADAIQNGFYEDFCYAMTEAVHEALLDTLIDSDATRYVLSRYLSLADDIFMNNPEEEDADD